MINNKFSINNDRIKALKSSSAKYFETVPECVKNIGKTFRPGVIVIPKDELLPTDLINNMGYRPSFFIEKHPAFVVGYNESNDLLLSFYDPLKGDYYENDYFPVCADLCELADDNIIKKYFRIIN